MYTPPTLHVSYGVIFRSKVELGTAPDGDQLEDSADQPNGRQSEGRELAKIESGAEGGPSTGKTKQSAVGAPSGFHEPSAGDDGGSGGDLESGQ